MRTTELEPGAVVVWKIARSSATPERVDVAVREILADALGRDAGSVRIEHTGNDKPRLVDGGSLEFNLAHSGSLAVLALGDGTAVGIDVERVRPLRDPIRLARRFFTPGEIAVVQAAPEQEASSAFLRLWVCKEAVLKGIGSGLRKRLNSFEVSIRRDGVVEVRTFAHNDNPKGWSVKMLDLGTEYVGALATKEPVSAIAYRTHG